MPELPKPKRRPLKMVPEGMEQLERLVRSLERIATGVESVVETLDAVIVERDGQPARVRVVNE